MTAPHCPACLDDVSVPYDFECWRCQACGVVFAVWEREEIDPHMEEDMTTITNAAGKEIDFDAASVLMDKELTHVLDHADTTGEQEYFDRYCDKHREKFGEEFEPNKANPVW